jgi:hypothetical protein
MFSTVNRSLSEERELRQALERAQTEYEQASDSDRQLARTKFGAALKAFSDYVIR